MINNNIAQILENLQIDNNRLSEDLIIILGPTASGKTKLAVELAEIIDAEIISADSRQVYKGMDIGTGKDLLEYGHIRYHLIDIIEAGEKYNVSNFLNDFERVYQDVKSRGKKIIVCGGTGFYIQALLKDMRFSQIPIDLNLREHLETIPKEHFPDLIQKITLPEDFVVDMSSKKRMIRAIEISYFLQQNPSYNLQANPIYNAAVFGLNPAVELRRTKISTRLEQRIEMGMITEVKSLLDLGVSFEELEYYGLEYKYISYYLKGNLSYDEFFTKLETEIHRYAKRQMTYFRKMEKDGVHIHWLS